MSFHHRLGRGHDVNMILTAGVDRKPQAGVAGQVCTL